LHKAAFDLFITAQELGGTYGDQLTQQAAVDMFAAATFPPVKLNWLQLFINPNFYD